MSKEKQLEKVIGQIIDDIASVSDFIFKKSNQFDEMSKGQVNVSKINDIHSLLAFTYMSGLNKNYTMLSKFSHELVISLLDKGVINTYLINLSIMAKRHECNLPI